MCIRDSIHILGLFIDYKMPSFRQQIQAFVDSRILRNEKMCRNLQEAGIDISFDKLKEAFPGSVITRGHYARYLLEHGLSLIHISTRLMALMIVITSFIFQLSRFISGNHHPFRNAAVSISPVKWRQQHFGKDGGDVYKRQGRTRPPGGCREGNYVMYLAAFTYFTEKQGICKPFLKNSM